MTANAALSWLTDRLGWFYLLAGMAPLAMASWLAFGRYGDVLLGPEGERTLAVEDFVVGPNQNALAPGELLVELILPRPPAGTADAYLRLTPRTEMDIAVAGAAVSISLDDSGTCTAARVAIGAVAPTALLVETAGDALVGSQLDQAAMDAAVAAARAAATPISDKRGTTEYRTHVVGVLVARALASAQDRITEARA